MAVGVDEVTFGPSGLDELLGVLKALGYQLIGPTVRGGAVVPGPIRGLPDLPKGVVDEQSPGRYRLSRTEQDTYFGFASTALSWKSYLFPARRMLWRVGADGEPEAPETPVPRQALIGLRACDLHAIGVQDRVFADRQYVDPDYLARRSRLFLVTVTCENPGDTCFCTSMGTGPWAEAGFDLALTEVHDGGSHRFVARAGTERGSDVLASLTTKAATYTDEVAASEVVDRAVRSMGRTLDVTDIRDLLRNNPEHPRWSDVAGRCLSCANCTLVCPTCFCSTAEEVSDLSGAVGRDRVWDSCFSLGHSYLHGGPTRTTTRTRYRQWLTHKFSSWIDQFGTSGCVGCGRCITSCPVGIDVTEEITAIRATAQGGDNSG